VDSNNQDLFGQFHNFLSMFHSPDRTGMNPSFGGVDGLVKFLGQAMPGLGAKIEQSQAMLGSAEVQEAFKGLGPIGEFFTQGFSGAFKQ